MPSHRPPRRSHVAGWRTSAPDRRGRSTEHDAPPALFLCLFLASSYGRGLRMVAGGILISLGAAAGGGLITGALAALGLAMLLEAQFDLCFAAPFLGCPVDGAQIRRRAALSL